MTRHGDLVERLRKWGTGPANDSAEEAPGPLLDEAADTIERLQDTLDAGDALIDALIDVIRSQTTELAEARELVEKLTGNIESGSYESTEQCLNEARAWLAANPARPPKDNRKDRLQ